MALKSKKALVAVLNEAGVDYSVNYEAYGRKVEGYIYPKDGTTLEAIKTAINDSEDGHEFKARKQESCGRIIVQVSYFKAYGWNH